jgi:CheY-like chemotaxis protein/nitrogen-specific signal transduction histidine kinase
MKRTAGRAKKRASDKKRAGKGPRKALRRKPRPAPVEAVLAAFAHDVRTPLTGILAISDLLATSGLPPRERQWAETIKASAEHLAALATVIVDAAKGQHGNLVLRQDVFDLGAIARAAAQSLAGRAAAKGLEARAVLGRRLPLVEGDAVRLRAALENLIDNAVKFTARGHVTLRVGATQAKGGKVTARFTVLDSGIGLKPADIRRLFKPFAQATPEIASRFGGAGLGLSSVRRLARAMGGDLQVTPKRGGAEFVLHVVLRRAPAVLQAEAPPSAEATRSLKVLCVEDNPFGRVVINTVLSELGHHVAFAASGEDAVAMAAGGGFDVVLTDMVLPGIDGVETIRRMRKTPRGRRLRIVGLSGREADAAAARAAGADDFVLKPVRPRALALVLAPAR